MRVEVARSTPASVRLDVLIPVLRAVIVADFFPGFNSALRANENSVLFFVRFRLGIRLARVVDVPCSVTPTLAVNGDCIGYAEEVLAPATVGFLCGYFFSRVLNDEFSSFEIMHRKKPESCFRALDDIERIGNFFRHVRESIADSWGEQNRFSASGTLYA